MHVYEVLVDLYIAGDATTASTEEALTCMEAAKSRSMIEMIFQSGQSLPLGEAGQSDLVRRIRDLREELNWYYHRIELEQLSPEEKTRQSLETLQEKAQLHEKELLRTLRELPANEREIATLEVPTEFSVERLQANLPQNATLVEYFSTGTGWWLNRYPGANSDPAGDASISSGSLSACLISTPKFRMGTEYVRRFEAPLLRATHSHLESLYAELIAPLRLLFQGTHLTIVPHGPLHFLPFHALRNGEEYLCDAFTVSYAPSATVFAMCQEKSASASTTSLVLGIADQRAPQF